MFRWLRSSSEQQQTQEGQWEARKVIKEQLDFAAKTEAEWEANQCEDRVDLDYQNKMQSRMRDVSCLIFFSIDNHIEALFPGSSSHRSFSSDYWFAILDSFSFPLW